jgi:hypothetical protein
VLQPYAYWSLTHRRADNTEVVYHGWVEQPGATRIEMQEAAATAALAALMGFLRVFRG